MAMAAWSLGESMTASWESPIGINWYQNMGHPISCWHTTRIFFYEAESNSVALTLSGHTHGGQIRFPHGTPLVRQSQFYLDEGAYAYNSSLLIVSRGLGSVVLPWRFGADPEAVLIDIIPPK